MAILFRNFKADDTEAVVTLWNNIFAHDAIDRPTFFEVVLCNFQFDPELFILAFDDNQVVGMIHGTAFKENQTGYVHFFGVLESRRRKGVGTQLFSKLLSKMTEAGCREVRFSDFPYNYILPGIDIDRYPSGLAFLIKHGFKTADAPVGMELDLTSYHYPEAVQEKKDKLTEAGYEVRLYEDQFFPHVLSLCSSHLQSDWQFTVQRAYLQKRLQQRGYLCFSKDGRDAESLVGFSFFNIAADDLRRFGPIGVNPHHRGVSIGEILLHECLMSQKQLGAAASYFLWSYDNNPAGHMYRKAGFTVVRRMNIMSRLM